MEDLVSMCESRCGKACNLRSAAEDSEETCHSGSSGGRAGRYRKRGSPKPAAGDAGAMDTDPSPVRLWDSEKHSEGYRTAYEQPSESEETARPPTRANTASEPSLEHDAEALERPARARTAPVTRHTEPTRDGMGDTPLAEESEAPGTAGCAGSGGKDAECHCEHVSFLMGKYPKMGMDAIVHRLDRLDNAKECLEEDVAGILDDQPAAERDMAELRAEPPPPPATHMSPLSSCLLFHSPFPVTSGISSYPIVCTCTPSTSHQPARTFLSRAVPSRTSLLFGI